MITTTEAKKLILDNQEKNKSALVPLKEATNLFLAKDLAAPISLPVFDSSAMDGFALRSDETENELTIVEEIWAGKNPEKTIKNGQCARIMTGAMIPEGADTVIMQEDVTVTGSTMKFECQIKKGSHVRLEGEEIKTGDTVLLKDHKLTPATLGLISSLGIDKCEAYLRPKVTIIATGTELVSPGEKLEASQIYESNSFALKSALDELPVDVTVFGPIEDDKTKLYDIINIALERSTHVIICGGVSVGDYDHNKSILNDLQVKSVFWKVAQKPGKPLFFGKKDSVSVFGVPGNPASSLVCYYEYIRPAILKSIGSESDVFLKEDKAILTDDVKKKAGREHFIRAFAEKRDGKLCVTPLTKQGSHMMVSFARANCFVVLGKDVESLNEGSEVDLHWLP